MAKNVIIMIGDGMGWEMARVASIYKQIQEGATGNTLSDFYTDGKGEGLSFQNLSGYGLVTTYGTTIADDGSTNPSSVGIYNTSNSALQGSRSARVTGEGEIRTGFEFNPTFNAGVNANGGGNVANGVVGNLVGYDPVSGGSAPWDSAYYGGTIPTGFNKEYIKFSYPDSANTATTLYTGVKSYNGAMGVDIFEQPLESVLAKASLLGKSTGLVSSVPVDHATPGAAASNVNDRNKFDQFGVLDTILQQELNVFKPTVILGGGHPLSNVKDPLPEGVEPPTEFGYLSQGTYNELSNNPTDNIYGYTFLERGADAAEVLAETAAEIDPNTGERLLGVYGARGQDGNLPTSSADGDYGTTGFNQFTLGYASPGSPIGVGDTDRPLLPGETDDQFIATEINENPNLSQLTSAALKVLEKDPDGFWIMIEGGDVDWGAHDNNLDNLIGNTLEFDKSVQTVIDWIAENGGWEENLLIVTADHDHYLTLNDNYPELVRTYGANALTYGLDVQDPDDAQNYDASTSSASGHFWGSDSTVKHGWTNHSNRPVPVYYQGSGSEILASLVGDGYEAYGYDIPGVNGFVDQVHIAQTMQVAVSGVELVGYAELPADTFAEGPPSGSQISSPNRTTPFASQPVQGFSGVQFASQNSFWFLSDNGFGSQTNSADYLLRIYKADPSFMGTENGNGSVNIESFIQLSDPNNLVPFDIVNEGTSDRLLTGADFDPESIVLADDGTIWIGDEFGPFVLHFDTEGVLLHAPIPTPNITNFNTLNGQAPIVIGHRGASGYLPEHTLEAYQLAIEMGADFIEPDLVSTKDGVLIARHEPILDGTTNVAEVFGEDRKSTKMLDGVETTAYFAEDFTLAEIKQLRATQRLPFRDQSYNGLYEIPTFAEVIDLVQEVEAETGKKIGIYPETKHPTFFDNQGLSLEEKVIAELVNQDFTDPSRIFIQSFEVQNLLDLQGQLDAQGLSDIPLVQLYDAVDAAPYDIVYNVAQGNDLSAIYGDLVNLIDGGITSETVYGDLENPEVLQWMSDNYAEGAGPWKNNIILRETLDEPVDGNGDGIAEITTQLTGEITSFVEDAHAAGLQVHPYTMRNEERYLTLNPDGTPQTPQQEYEQLIRIGFDGFFTDFTDTAVSVVASVTAEYVQSPDNPFLEDPADANLGSSGGFEGMGYSPDRSTLYPLLEKTVKGDPQGALRIYEFDVASQTFADELAGLYQMDAPNHAIGDMTPINDHEFLIIERDGGQGDSANFKKIFKIDISNLDENGFVAKQEVVDLLNIADPNDLNGDGSLVFTFPFVTIEDVIVLDAETILVANDNNYPFSIGRGPDIDNDEIIQLKLPTPLNLDSRLGVPNTSIMEVSLTSSPAVVQEGGQLTWDFGLSNPVPTGGLVIHLDLTEDTDPLPGDIQYNVAGSENITNFQLITVNGVIQGANITLTEGATDAKLVSNVIADNLTEGSENATFTLVDGEGYNANPESNEASFTIEDTSVTPVTPPPKLVNGTAGDDYFDSAFPDAKKFVGEEQMLFTGSGDDYVDVSQTGQGNRLDTGSGDDMVFAGTNNRIILGAGDDILYAGSGNGGNMITGGAGADQFWLIQDEDEIPEMINKINDFKSEDVIGFMNTDLSLANKGSMWNYAQNGDNVIISAFGQEIAQLLKTTVSDANFVFA